MSLSASSYVNRRSRSTSPANRRIFGNAVIHCHSSRAIRSKARNIGEAIHSTRRDLVPEQATRRIERPTGEPLASESQQGHGGGRVVQAKACGHLRRFGALRGMEILQ